MLVAAAIGWHVQHRIAGHQDVALIWRFKTCDHSQCGRFATPRWTEQPDEFRRVTRDRDDRRHASSEPCVTFCSVKVVIFATKASKPGRTKTDGFQKAGARKINAAPTTAPTECTDRTAPLLDDDLAGDEAESMMIGSVRTAGHRPAKRPVDIVEGIDEGQQEAGLWAGWSACGRVMRQSTVRCDDRRRLCRLLPFVGSDARKAAGRNQIMKSSVKTS